MEKFGDPSFEYHQTMVRVWGLLALRLADDLILPIHPMDYVTELQKYVHQLYIHTAPHTFPTLKKSIHALMKTATAFEVSLTQINKKLRQFKGDQPLSARWAKRVEKMNERLMGFERGFLDQEGITGRTWFKHVVYAPGLWTGYSGQVFPAIAEAYDAKDMPLARYAETKAAECMKQAQDALN